EIEFVIPETPEHLPDNLPVFPEIGVSDEDVVEINHDISGQDQVLENVVHHGLERRGGVGQAEVHYQGFEQTPVGPERGMPLVALADPDVVETPPDVELREEARSLETIDQIVD